MPLCTAPESQVRPIAIADGAGGAIVTWITWHASDVTDLFAQRVSASGAVAWGENGVPVCDGEGSNYSFACVSDGSQGVIVAFDDTRGGGTADLYVQRLDASGVRQWAPQGEPLCIRPFNQQWPRAVPDGAGGAIVTWGYDYRGGTYNELYVQRIGPTGAPLWTVNGAPLVTGSDTFWPTIVSDAKGGAVVSWTRLGPITDIRAQRVDGSGSPQWGPEGIAVSSAPGGQHDPESVADGDGGAIVVWTDERSGVEPDFFSDIYAQRVPLDAAVPTLVLRTAASVSPGSIHLEWWLREVTSPGFTVERATNERPWVEVGPAVTEESTRLVFDDSGVRSGTRYGYRLAHGPTGQRENLGEIWVDIPAVPGLALAARPNPIVAGKVRVELRLPLDSPAVLEVVDLSGRRIGHRHVVSPGVGSHVIEIGDRPLAPGRYVVRLVQGDRSVSVPVIVIR